MSKVFMLYLILSSGIITNEFDTMEACQMKGQIAANGIAASTGMGVRWTCVPVDVDWMKV